jgi:hypothetical protein
MITCKAKLSRDIIFVQQKKPPQDAAWSQRVCEIRNSHNLYNSIHAYAIRPLMASLNSNSRTIKKKVMTKICLRDLLSIPNVGCVAAIPMLLGLLWAPLEDETPVPKATHDLHGGAFAPLAFPMTRTAVM